MIRTGAIASSPLRGSFGGSRSNVASFVAAILLSLAACSSSPYNPADPADDEYTNLQLLHCLFRECLGYPVTIAAGIESGNGAVWFSRDTRTWAKVLTGPYQFQTAGYADGRFVVAGYRSAVSTDGRNWQTAELIGGTESLAFGRGRIVIVGEELACPHHGTTGLSWSTAACSATGVSSVSFNGTSFLVFTESATNHYSDDGITWSPSVGPIGLGHTGAASNGDRFVGVANSSGNGGAAYSTDNGRNVTAYSLVGVPMNDIAYYAPLKLFVAVGPTVTGIRTSPDGTNGSWSTSAFAPGVDLHSVAALDGELLAGGAGGQIFRSADGITWTSHASIPGAGPVHAFARGWAKP